MNAVSLRAWQVLSEVRFARGELANAERELEPALVHARNAEDLGEQTAIYSRLGTIFARGPTPVGEAIRRCQEILAETEGNRTIAGVMYHPLAHMKARQGEFEEALRLGTMCREIHRENGAMWSYWVYAEILWDVKMLAGEPADALEILSEGYEHDRAMGETFPLLSSWLAQSLYALGRFDEAERRAQAAVDAVDDDSGGPRGMGALARVWAQHGRVEEAERDGERRGRLLRANRLLDRTARLGPCWIWPKSSGWPDVPTRRSPPSARRSVCSSSGKTSSPPLTRGP